MNKIQELKEEIRRIEEEEIEELRRKYQFLVGTYIRTAFTSYDKITSIEDVTSDPYDDIISFNSIYVYFDERKGAHSIYACIECAASGSIEASEITRSMITKDEFDKAFNDCFDLMKKRSNNE